MADDPPEILTKHFCDLAFIEYADRKWGKKYNCGTAGRKQNFGITKDPTKLKEAITNNRIEYNESREIPNTLQNIYKFQRKDKLSVNNLLPVRGKSFWFVGALIYHPALQHSIYKLPNNINIINQGVVSKLFTHFFVKEKDDIMVTQNKRSWSSKESRLPIDGGFYGDRYITSVKEHFGWKRGHQSGIVDSLFKGILTKTYTQFMREVKGLTTDKHFNPFNVINQFNTDDKIIAEMGIPCLIAGYYDGVDIITLYPNIPVYQFLLKDRAAYNNERERLARIEAARLARERALIASVVAIHANDAEEPRPLVRDADEDEEARVAEAVVASIVAINSEQAARLAAERQEVERRAEEERLAREAEEAQRAAEQQRLAREEANNKAVVASFVAINSEQAARLAARRVADEEEERQRLVREEAAQLAAEAAVREAANNKAIVAVIAAINAENAAQDIEEVVEEVEIEEPVANNKAVVASIVAINSEQAARQAAAREAARQAAAREAARQAAAREAERLKREAANKATIASIVSINSEQAARVEAVNLNDDNERKLRNSIIAIISAIISNKPPITNTNYNFIDIFYFRNPRDRDFNPRPTFDFPGPNHTVLNILKTKYETLQALSIKRLDQITNNKVLNKNIKKLEEKIVNIVFKDSFNIYDTAKINQLLAMIRRKSNGVQQQLVIPRFKNTIDVLSFKMPESIINALLPHNQQIEEIQELIRQKNETDVEQLILYNQRKERYQGDLNNIERRLGELERRLDDNRQHAIEINKRPRQPNPNWNQEQKQALNRLYDDNNHIDIDKLRMQEEEKTLRKNLNKHMDDYNVKKQQHKKNINMLNQKLVQKGLEQEQTIRIQTEDKHSNIYDIVFSVLFITKFLNDGTKYFYVSRTLINNYRDFFREIEKYVKIPNTLQADFKEMFLKHIRKTIIDKNPEDIRNLVAEAGIAITSNDAIRDNNDEDRIRMLYLYNTISRNNPLVLGLRLEYDEIILTEYALKIINFIMFFVGFVNQSKVYFYTYHEEQHKPNVVPWYYDGEDFGERQNEYLDGDNNIRDNIIWCTDNGNINDRNNTNTERQEQGQHYAAAAHNINDVGAGDGARPPGRRDAGDR